MVEGNNPVKLLPNAPDPSPFVVFESVITGFGVVLQHTPLDVTEPFPSEVMSPPPEAEDAVMAVIWSVVRTESVTTVDFLHCVIRSKMLKMLRKTYILFMADRFVMRQIINKIFP